MFTTLIIMGAIWTGGLVWSVFGGLVLVPQSAVSVGGARVTVPPAVQSPAPPLSLSKGQAGATSPRVVTSTHVDPNYNTVTNSLRIPSTLVTTSINQIGPGIVKLHLCILNRFNFVVSQYITPIAPTNVLCIHTMHAEHGVPRWLSIAVLHALDAQFMRDHPIWENKRYEPTPSLSVMDGPILGFRRWYSQFYGPSSMPFSEAMSREYMLEAW